MSPDIQTLLDKLNAAMERHRELLAKFQELTLANVEEIKKARELCGTPDTVPIPIVVDEAEQGLPPELGDGVPPAGEG